MRVLRDALSVVRCPLSLMRDAKRITLNGKRKTWIPLALTTEDGRWAIGSCR
jgi:hypothetical protein